MRQACTSPNTHATSIAYDHEQMVKQILNESASSWLINQIPGSQLTTETASFCLVIAGASHMT